MDHAGAVVTRASHGQASFVETFTAETADGKTFEIPIEIQAEQYSKEECLRLLEQAQEAFESAFLGENTSSEQVQTDLFLPDTWMDGMVEADYVSSQPEILNYDGTVYADELKEAHPVGIQVTFTCQDQQLEYDTWVNVIPKVYNGDEKIRQDILRAVRAQEEASRQTGTFELPEQVGGQGITWSREPDRSFLYLVFLAGIALICLRIRNQQKEKKERAVYQKKLLLEYPQMVMQLSLLMGINYPPEIFDFLAD